MFGRKKVFLAGIAVFTFSSLGGGDRRLGREGARRAASGLQQTFLQVGGALGTSVLGAILTAGIGATILGKLAGVGVTGRVKTQVAAGRTAIAQGVVPIPSGTSAAVAARITEASLRRR